MIRVALIGDVHANLPALDAALAHAQQSGAEAVWNVGDFLGYGAFPDQVVRRLRRADALSIVGNYDLKVLKFKRKQEKWRQSKHPLKFLAFQWAFENLSKKSRRYLRGLPLELRLQVEGRRVLLTHGSPTSNEEALTPFTPAARLRELAQIATADLIICGHSHQPFTSEIGGVWFINPGSVGRPDDGDPRPCYALLELGRDHLRVEHHRSEYDAERAAAAVRDCGLPEVFAQMALRGLSLDTLLSTPT